MRLFGVQVVYGFSPEARIFAQLLGNRSSDFDARVAMHAQRDRLDAVEQFTDMAHCDVWPIDTGWRENASGTGRGIVAKLAMGLQYSQSLPKITDSAREYRPDLIYSCQQHFDLYAASRVADSLKKPLVIHLHYTIGPWLKGTALKRLLSCQHVIAISDFIRTEALRHGVAPENVTTVRNALTPLPKVEPGEALAVRQELGIPTSAFVFGMVSRLVSTKGHADSIAAFVRASGACDDAWLVIVGAGPMEQELRAQASASSAAARIIFTGLRRDVPRLLASFDAFAHPSRYEPFGLAIAEASSAGLPVLAYAEGAVPEIVISGATGLLVEAGNIEALADAMTQLYCDPERAKSMGQAGSERIATQFRPVDSGAAFEATLRRLI